MPPRDFELKLKLQGCADAGLCYPPQTWTTARGRRGGRAAAPPAVAGAPPRTDRASACKRLLGGGSKSEGGFLPMDQAFVFSTSSSSPDRVTLRWVIADGYYLYRDKV